MEFIINNLPIIICALIGIFLLVVEAFMPGIGVPGISGVLLLAAAVVFTWRGYGATAGLLMAVGVLVVSALSVLVSFRSTSKGRLSRTSMVLKDVSSQQDGYLATEDRKGYVGKKGQALTVLRPSGLAEFAGERINVVSRGDFIEKGSYVQVVEAEGSRVVVEKING